MCIICGGTFQVKEVPSSDGKEITFTKEFACLCKECQTSDMSFKDYPWSDKPRYLVPVKIHKSRSGGGGNANFTRQRGGIIPT